jgi:C-terminal processing protease CtpA/Prc
MKKLTALIISLSFIIGIYIFSNIVIVAKKNPVNDKTVDAKAQKAVIEELVKDLNENYVFPEVAQKMGDDLMARLKKNEYSQITDAVQFANKLTEDMQAISSDKHLRVRYSARELPVRATRTEPTEEERKQMEAYGRDINYGFAKVERLQGNIGYVELRGFFDHEQGEQTVKYAMNFLGNTEALIFDLRRNGGGSPEMVALISSYLFGDKPVHLNSLYWRQGDVTNEFWTKPEKANIKFEGKPVYVLTSDRTFSAAEEFSYNLKNLKRATIVGETTGGGAHPGGSFRLSKHFSAFIATGRAISPITKTNWEGTGVEPDVKISKEKALDKAHILALEKVVEKISDEDRKKSLEQVIEGMKKKMTDEPKGVAKKNNIIF